MNHTIPSTIVDGFFDDPYRVREFGLQSAQSIQSDHNGLAYRGERSECLSVIHPGLFDHINKRILSSFYNLNKENISWNSEIKFQLTDESFGDGWVHTDHYEPSLLTGIIYLTPNAPLECGTSLYRAKNIVAHPLHNDLKKKANVDLELRQSDYYSKCREENNQQFEKILTVNNLFNRMVIFDSSCFHCADRFFGNTRDTSRLTLVISILELYVNQTPITRIRSV
jgi:hypothetical protein